MLIADNFVELPVIISAISGNVGLSISGLTIDILSTRLDSVATPFRYDTFSRWLSSSPSSAINLSISFRSNEYFYRLLYSVWCTQAQDQKSMFF